MWSMETTKVKSILVIPIEEWNAMKEEIRRIAEKVEQMNVNSRGSAPVRSPYITAKEFMAAVRICRSNFDKLVSRRKIMTLKKGRKVYVVASEVERYFKEVEV